MGRNFCKLAFDCENHQNFNLPCKNFLLYGSLTYIPPWGVVDLHIGVGHSQTPTCNALQSSLLLLSPDTVQMAAFFGNLKKEHCLQQLKKTTTDFNRLLRFTPQCIDS